MSDVFVSYKAEDRRLVQALVEALQGDGLSVWWDAQIGGGAAWRESIEQHLDEAKCVIVIWSKRSIGHEGHFVRDEAARAQRRGIYLPVLIDKVEPPLGFGESQAISLVGWRGDRSHLAYRAVSEAALSIIAGMPFEGHAHPTSHARVSRRAVIAGGAVATAAIAGGAGWVLLRPAAAKADTIAVLPFANLSGDPTQAYFSDGIAEELRNALGRVAGLKVVGRTSSEAVRNEDAGAVAKRLNVANILTGSVRRSPSLIRVSAQLIDGRSGLEKWSENYDRAPGDAIRIQTDIAQNVARALSVALGRTARAAITLGGTNNANAHDQYLKAVALAQSSDDPSIYRQALQLLDSAIDADPRYAEAYARRAIVLRQLFGLYASNSDVWDRAARQAAASAQKAIDLAPTFAAGHVALGTVMAGQLNLPAALDQYRRAELLSPNDPQLLLDYSQFLSEIGRPAEALSRARKAIQLDPLNPKAYEKQMWAFYAARRYPDLIQAAKQVLALSPKNGTAIASLGDGYVLTGRYNEARRAYASGPQDHSFILSSEAILADRLGDRQTSDRLLGRLRELYGDAASYQYADIYAQRGEKDEALAAIERGWSVRDPGIGFMQVDPYLDPIRNEPRFQAIVRKLNFPS